MKKTFFKGGGGQKGEKNSGAELENSVGGLGGGGGGRGVFTRALKFDFRERDFFKKRPVGFGQRDFFKLKGQS